MSQYAQASDIAKRLRSEMPLSLTLHDPVSGQPYTIQRENVLAMLVVDAPNIVLEAQMLPLLYGEMARAQRACERAQATAERSFVGWKAQVAAEARAKASKEGGKLTNDAAAEAYRTHPEYEEKANLAAYYEKLAGLFDDFKRAFDIKGRMIEAVLRTHAGDFRANRAHATSIEAEENGAAAAFAASRGQPVAPPGYTAPAPPPPMLPGMPGMPPPPPMVAEPTTTPVPPQPRGRSARPLDE